MKALKGTVNDHKMVSVFAKVEYGQSDDLGQKWTKIGSGTQNIDGSIDIEFDCCPTNVSAIQIRPMSATADSTRS